MKFENGTQFAFLPLNTSLKNVPFFYTFPLFVILLLSQTREQNLNTLPKTVYCFLACAKAENVSENWGTSSPTLLNLIDLVISKSICGQDAPSNNNLPRESGLESFFDPHFQPAHRSGLK